MRVAILGCCVTRSLWGFEIESMGRYEVGPFLSRATVASMLAQPLPAEVRDWDLEEHSGFDAVRFAWDLDKHYFPVLEEREWDALLVDLIVERHPTYWLSDAAVTYTGFARPLLGALLDRGIGRVREPLDDPDATFEALRALGSRLRGIAAGRQVIVHCARRARCYLNGDDLVPFPRQDHLLEWNDHYERCYDTLIEAGGFGRICLPLDKIVAGGNHLWELGPTHYDRSYYVELASELRRQLD